MVLLQQTASVAFVTLVIPLFLVEGGKLTPSKFRKEGEDEDDRKAPITCGQPTFAPYERHPLANKGTVRPHSWPWHVSIRYRSRHRCSGVLLSRRHILTSAHCFSTSSTDPMDFEVWLGKHHRDNMEIGRDQQLPIEQIILHPDFAVKSIYDADLAIIRLDAPGAWANTNFTSPICLDPPSTLMETSRRSSSRRLPTGTCYVSGFGHMSNLRPKERTAMVDQIPVDPTLKQVEVPLISIDRCGRRNRAIKPHLTGNVMCADVTNNQPDCCEIADSGSPLVCKDNSTQSWWLAGIASSGMECSKKTTPTVFVQVGNYLSWITKNVFDRDNIVGPY